jgi:DNA primase
VAGQIPRAFIQELIGRTDIIDVIDARVSLKKASSQNYTACCPFHQEKTPSFTVSVRKQFYHCFGCGEHGDVLKFLMTFDRLEFVDAVEYLAAQQGLTVPYEERAGMSHKPKADHRNLYDYLKAAAEFYQQTLQHSPPAQTYLQTRGLSEDIQTRYGIGYAPAHGHALTQHVNVNEHNFSHFHAAGLIGQGQSGRYYDVFRDRIMFPIRDRQGRVVGFGGRIFQNTTDKDGQPLAKYYNTGQTPVFNKSAELYGLYEALQAQRELPYALLVEGYMDVIALAQYGFSNAMASMGTAATKQHLERLYRHTNKIVFCFDGDAAGQKAAVKALTTALPLLNDGRQLQLIFLPDNHDPDSFIRAHGVDAFNKQLSDAQNFDDFFWRMLREDAELSHAGGRAAFYQKAISFLSQLPQGKLSEIMHQELTRLTRMEAKPEPLPPSKRIVGQHPPLSLQEKAFALILQQPTMVQTVALDASDTMKPDWYQALDALVAMIKEEAIDTTAGLLRHLQTHPNLARYTELACYPLLTPDNGMAEELQDCLQKLRLQEKRDAIETLMNKMRAGHASPDDRQQLQTLLTQQ